MSKDTVAPGANERPLGIAYLIGRVDHMLSQQLRDSLKQQGLTVSQYTMLSMLQAHGQLSNAQLAERSMVSPQSANEMVKIMEGKGWIEREPDPTHGRIINLRLTETALALLVACDRVVALQEQRMLAEVAGDERQQLQRLLRALVRGLDNSAG
ncbi:MarR family winged helix-turn-helix transcriptional regulator [Vogesella oryzae]|uniref:MarR family winged helix-turn-helix transcriptional regulator n=1 Tax=Vogesella oryzae TaxID=1735285 RepID=UPI001583EBED|nr:MarR family transcriptional regulator [Vogesella oryzae]